MLPELPVSQKLLEPHVPRKQTVKECDQQQKEKQKKYYDLRRRAKEQPSFYPGEDVWIPDQGTEGKILQEEAQRSYSVITPREGIIRRNRRHLNPLPLQPEEQRELQRSEPVNDTMSTNMEEHDFKEIVLEVDVQ